MKRQLCLQELESRDVPSAVTFDGYTFQVAGSALADTVVVSYDGGAWWTPFDDQVKVTLTNPSETIQATANFWSVKRIAFEGMAGADDFRNNTDVSTTANGGEGDDTLVGSGSADFLVGGAGRDTLDGMGSDAGPPGRSRPLDAVSVATPRDAATELRTAIGSSGWSAW